MTPPTYAKTGLPYLSTEQMIEVDRLMIERYGIELIQMMENAGHDLANLARSRFLQGDPRGKTIIVLAGTGGNGGGALVCARRLHNWGAHVHVLATKTDEAFSTVPAHQLAILRQMEVPIDRHPENPILATADLIVDGIIGYNLQGAPRGEAANLIRWANDQNTSILALDVPSGLDGTTGAISERTIKAAATLTLALPKIGLSMLDAESHVGELYLGDISVPPALYSEPSLGLHVDNIFARGEIVQLR